VSGKAWDDNGLRTVEQCRKRLNPKGYVRFPDHAPVPIVWPLIFILRFSDGIDPTP